jgi:hypothetical protein
VSDEEKQKEGKAELEGKAGTGMSKGTGATHSGGIGLSTHP